MHPIAPFYSISHTKRLGLLEVLGVMMFTRASSGRIYATHAGKIDDQCRVGVIYQEGMFCARSHDNTTHSMKNARAVGLLNPMRDKN